MEDTATYIEKSARQRATQALLKAPLMYFRSHMTGNIHGRLNRNLEGTSRLIKLIFMDFAPAVASGIAAIIVIFVKLPVTVACIVILVIPLGTFIRHPGGTDEYKGGHGWHYGGTAWRY